VKFWLGRPGDRKARASYGYDPARGFYVDITLNGALSTYDGQSEVYDPERPLQGALSFLIKHGFIFEDDLVLGLDRMQYQQLRELPHHLRRAVCVYLNWKRACD